jgi:hypothetical protein
MYRCYVTERVLRLCFTAAIATAFTHCDSGAPARPLASTSESSGQFWCRNRSPSFSEYKECFPSKKECEAPPNGETLPCHSRDSAYCSEYLSEQKKFNICFASSGECSDWCATGRCLSRPPCGPHRPEQY